MFGCVTSVVYHGLGSLSPVYRSTFGTSSKEEIGARPVFLLCKGREVNGSFLIFWRTEVPEEKELLKIKGRISVTVEEDHHGQGTVTSSTSDISYYITNVYGRDLSTPDRVQSLDDRRSVSWDPFSRLKRHGSE